MNAVGIYFLRAKHWQIFLLVVGAYFVGEMAVMKSILVSPLARGGLTIALVMAVSASGFFVWFWSMGSFFVAIVKEELRLKLGFFYFALIYTPSYFAFFIATFQSSGRELLEVILPLHFFAMFCMFYILYFVSKSLILAETSKPASFYDYAGPFFLLWFFPIGIWIVQPRVNRLYAEKGNAERLAMG